VPWIDKELCTGCGICIDECPVDTIVMTDSVTEIEMDGCIRCAICHGICPTDAIKHDSEKVDEWIEGKVSKAIRDWKLCEELLGNPRDGKDSFERTIKSYKRNEYILQKAIEKLEDIYKTL